MKLQREEEIIREVGAKDGKGEGQINQMFQLNIWQARL